MGKGQYFRRWLQEAWRHSWSGSELIMSVASVGLGAVFHFWPAIEAAMSDLVWQLPLWALGGVLAFRLVMAPYWIAKREDEVTSQLRLETAQRLRKDEFYVEIAKLVQQGRALINRRIKHDEFEPWLASTEEWIRKSFETVQEFVSPGKAAIFVSAPSYYASDWSGSVSDAHNAARSKLDVYIKRLMDLAE